MRRTALATLALVACQRPPTPTTEPAEPSPSVLTSASEGPPAASLSAGRSEPPPEPPPPAPTTAVPAFVAAEVPTVRPPTVAACRFETAGLRGQPRALGLRIAPDEPAFLHASGGQLRLFLPVGASEPTVTLLRPGLVLHALAPRDVQLRASKPVLFGGVLLATSRTSFTLVGARTGQVVPSLVRPLVSTEQGFEPHPCADFTLDESSFDASAFAPKGKIVKQTYLRAGTVTITATVAAERSFVLSAELSGAPVTLIDEAAGRARFVLVRSDGIVIGRAPRADLLHEAPTLVDFGFGGLGLTGVGSGSGHRPDPPREITCPRALPLYVDMTVVPRTGPFARAYAVVGTLERGRPIQVRRSGRSLDRLERVPLEGITFAQEGALSVRREDLRDCAITTSRSSP